MHAAALQHGRTIGLAHSQEQQRNAQRSGAAAEQDPLPAKHVQRAKVGRPGAAGHHEAPADQRLARGALAPGGVVFLRTDDADYFQQMNEVFGAAAAFFQKTETSSSLAKITTDFERDFNAQGIPTLRAAYKVLSF